MTSDFATVSEKTIDVPATLDTIWKKYRHLQGIEPDAIAIHPDLAFAMILLGNAPAIQRYFMNMGNNVFESKLWGTRILVDPMLKDVGDFRPIFDLGRAPQAEIAARILAEYETTFTRKG